VYLGKNSIPTPCAHSSRPTASRSASPAPTPHSRTTKRSGFFDRMLNDCVRTLLLHSAALIAFWAEAHSTVMYLINRRPCTSTGIATLFQLLFGSPPDYSNLRVFDSLCYPNTTTHKLYLQSTACVFIGYHADHHGFRCYDLNTKCVITLRQCDVRRVHIPVLVVNQRLCLPCP
jgi:hypothetical protein